MNDERRANNPSMTITSTTPAPEGSDSTSRETMSDKINRLIRRELDAS